MSTTTQVPTHVTSAARAPTAERQRVWKHGVASATLITLHTVAAAIVVPTLAGRLARTR